MVWEDVLYLAAVNHTMVVTFCKKGFTTSLILILPNTWEPMRRMKMYMLTLVTECGQGCMHLQSILNLLRCLFPQISIVDKKCVIFKKISLFWNLILKSLIYYHWFLYSKFFMRWISNLNSFQNLHLYSPISHFSIEICPASQMLKFVSPP